MKKNPDYALAPLLYSAIVTSVSKFGITPKHHGRIEFGISRRGKRLFVGGGKEKMKNFTVLTTIFSVNYVFLKIVRCWLQAIFP